MRTERGGEEELEEYNALVRRSRDYEEHLQAQMTEVLFCDEDEPEAYTFSTQERGWAQVTQDLLCSIRKGVTSGDITIMNKKNAIRRYSDDEYKEQYISQIDHLLEDMTRLYLKRIIFEEMSYNVDHDKKTYQRASMLNNELDIGNKELLNRSHIIDFINSSIKSGKGTPLSRELTAYQRRKIRTIQKFEEYRSSCSLSPIDICKLCGISSSTYYRMAKIDAKEKAKRMVECRRRILSKLTTRQEHKEIVEMVEDPKYCYSAVDISAELSKKHNVSISPSVIRYHLKRTGYRFKRNKYKAPEAFGVGQQLMELEVARQVLRYIGEERIIIAIDETNINIGMNKEYSYCRSASRPYRCKKRIPQRLHLCMAITERGIFGYQLSRCSFNSHSFCNFLIKILERLYICEDYARNVVLFIDQASIHTAKITLKLFRLLHCEVLFNGVGCSDFLPIESVFSVIKKSMKTVYCSEMYD